MPLVGGDDVGYLCPHKDENSHKQLIPHTGSIAIKQRTEGIRSCTHIFDWHQFFDGAATEQVRASSLDVCLTCLEVLSRRHPPPEQFPFLLP